MKKYRSLLLMLILATFVVAPGWAQADSGFYVSGDLGANFSKSVGFTGDSNDVASHCDALTNPDLEGCRADDFRYTNTFIPDWAVDFDGGQGILLGTAIGYSIGDNNPQHIFSGIRMEVEYFYRQSRHNQSSKVRGLSGATQQKIERGEFADGPYETLGSVVSHNLFANVFYDFDNDTRFTPYLGVGGGLGITTADWGSNWTRTLNEADIRQGLRDDNRPDLAANDEYVSRLAGSSSAVHTALDDVLWGFQVLFGVDYTLSERTSLGLKGRWVKFTDFSDGIVWDPLRSHAPYVGGTVANPTNPVSGNMSTSDIEFFGISLNLKYHF